jgi:hypothetical protein
VVVELVDLYQVLELLAQAKLILVVVLVVLVGEVDPVRLRVDQVS